ncbi:MAG: 5'-methylthioadenosine/adenosylhomocysteine nucleosidase [Spirochaetales bacterium]|nr:5'-methylthioadenosine/adenosylhomocysteine nucleosidase [Spirochaetales bacterium]
MIAIIAAMQPEIKLIKDSVENPEKIVWKDWEFVCGKLSGKEIVAVQTGVGKVLAALVTQRMIDVFSPSAIIMTGIAGALNPDLHRGDIVVGTDCLQHDMDATVFGFKRGQIPYTDYRIIESDPALVAAALSYPAEKLRTGRILTGDQFVTGSGDAALSYLTDELEGDVVEMEGAAAGLTAKVNDIPFLLIRVISDKADGKAKGSYQKFLKSASERSFHLIEYLLEGI